MKNNCYINVKVLFENVRACVRARPYPPFPTTRATLRIFFLNYDLTTSAICQQLSNVILHTAKHYPEIMNCNASSDRIYVYVTTDPNCSSGKIKQTPPVDSYTIILVLLLLNTTQTT